MVETRRRRSYHGTDCKGGGSVRIHGVISFPGHGLISFPWGARI